MLDTNGRTRRQQTHFPDFPMAATEPSPSSSLRRAPWWAVVIIAALVALALFGDKGVLRALQANRQKSALGAEVKTQEAANGELRRQIEALRNDPRTIENLARKELGMVKDDELVYQFRNPPRSSTPPSPAHAETPPDK
jgi:cell division protein FtsB